jgi:hypothetical protein
VSKGIFPVSRSIQHEPADPRQSRAEVISGDAAGHTSFFRFTSGFESNKNVTTSGSKGHIGSIHELSKSEPLFP